MKIRVSILTIFLTISLAVTSQVDGYHRDIIELLNHNGTKQEYEMMFDSTIEKLKSQFLSAEVPNEFWERVYKDKESSVEEAISFLSFAYRKHFTRNEIKALLAFYQTEAAQKFVQNIADITVEEKKVISTFFESEIGVKLEKTREELSKDISEISKEWRKDVFSKSMSALVRSGHLTN